MSALLERWLSAEAERKVRKREKRIAWMLAFRAGVEIMNDEDTDEKLNDKYRAETDEAKSALALARDATRVYRIVAGQARGRRSALTRSVAVPTPVPNAAVAAAFAALVARETSLGSRYLTPEERSI